MTDLKTSFEKKSSGCYLDDYSVEWKVKLALIGLKKSGSKPLRDGERQALLDHPKEVLKKLDKDFDTKQITDQEAKTFVESYIKLYLNELDKKIDEKPVSRDSRKCSFTEMVGNFFHVLIHFDTKYGKLFDKEYGFWAQVKCLNDGCLRKITQEKLLEVSFNNFIDGEFDKDKLYAMYKILPDDDKLIESLKNEFNERSEEYYPIDGEEDNDLPPQTKKVNEKEINNIIANILSFKQDKILEQNQEDDVTLEGEENNINWENDNINI